MLFLLAVHRTVVSSTKETAFGAIFYRPPAGVGLRSVPASPAIPCRPVDFAELPKPDLRCVCAESIPGVADERRAGGCAGTATGTCQ